MTLTLYADRNRTVPLMQLEKQSDGTIVIYLGEPQQRINFLPNEVELVKKFLELEA